MWFTFLTLIIAEVSAYINKGKSRKPLFDADSAESPFTYDQNHKLKLCMSCDATRIVYEKPLLGTKNAVFETCKTKNQIFVENFAPNGAWAGFYDC